MADIGSGAGFPGIPVAVLRPECQVALIESDHRKAAFLREATRDYPNVRIMRERAESAGEEFDWALSRAREPRRIAGVGPVGSQRCLSRRRGAPDCPAFTWETRTPPPHGASIGILWLGRSATYVSRET